MVVEKMLQHRSKKLFEDCLEGYGIVTLFYSCRQDCFFKANTADYFIKNGNLEYLGGTYNSGFYNPSGSNNVAFRC